jgi:DNA-binding MarR family transcriptional regulator
MPVKMWHDGPIPDELARFPGYLLARLGQASQQRFHAALKPESMHPRLFGVMNILASQPGITQQRLAEHTAIDTSSMVAVIDELESRGLAERRPHPEDRRARAVYLTPSGQKTLIRLRGLAATVQRDFFAALSESELAELQRLLQKLAESRIGSPSSAPGDAPRAGDNV